MGVPEAVAEGNRRFAAERSERQAQAEAARAEQVAKAAELARTKDLEERRESARRDGRLNYIAKVKPLEASALAANRAQSALDAALSDPASATVEELFTLWSARETTKAAHATLRASVAAYEFIATHPGEQLPGRYIDRTPQATFADLLSQVIGARAAATALAAQVPTEVFAKADQAGEQAAKLVE